MFTFFLIFLSTTAMDVVTVILMFIETDVECNPFNHDYRMRTRDVDGWIGKVLKDFLVDKILMKKINFNEKNAV